MSHSSADEEYLLPGTKANTASSATYAKCANRQQHYDACFPLTVMSSCSECANRNQAAH